MKPAHRLSGIAPSLIRQIYQSAPEGAVNLGLGEINLPHPPEFTAAITTILHSNVHRYTPNAGMPQLRQAVASHHGIPSADGVCITNGAEEALYCTLMSYINPGDEVLIADPSFVAYETIIKMAGGIPRRFALPASHGFALDAHSFAAAISDATKLVLLCHPSNPTGVAFTPAEMQHITSLCRKHSTLLVVDEIYREMYITEPIPNFAEIAADCIIVGGISKSHGVTGWRLGWCYSAQPELIAPVITTHQYVSTCAPAPSQHLALWALSPQGQQVTRQLRRQLAANRTTLVQTLTSKLPTCNISPAAAHPYVLLHLPEVDDLALARHLATQGVITVPGSAFGMQSRHWLRLTYALAPQQLASGLEKLLNGIKNYQQKNI
jgi:aspartate/methionine/tyrosine aminotransferase